MLSGFCIILGALLYAERCTAFLRNPPRTSRATTPLHSLTDKVSHPIPAFLTQSFNTECDNTNRPPSLNILLRSIQQLTYSGSDIRGYFVDHSRFGSLASVAHEIGKVQLHYPALTPLAAYCLGHALADQLLLEHSEDEIIQIAIGQDPRLHGKRLVDSFARGAEAADPKVRVVYAGIATTPACAAFVSLHHCHAGVMVTASHLPSDRNGFKIFYRNGGMTLPVLQDLGARAGTILNQWFSAGILPPASGGVEVRCSAHVSYMPAYAESLKRAVIQNVGRENKPLEGLKIVFNPGNGSGGFFYDVLKDLGADVSGSIHLEPDGNFPNGVPNPEYEPMLSSTIRACEASGADLGIMLDTDADRCGFVTRGKDGIYEPLNRNRLIALLGVVFAESSPGCAFVTDSVTSEGLSTFLKGLGLTHVRYVKGYMNVISKAKELTESGELNAEVAIETSGHCAMKENSYLDDGTYTAVKVVSLLAKQRATQQCPSLLDLISSMPEMDEISELRMPVFDKSIETMREVFDLCALTMEDQSSMPSNTWETDTENLEGIRIRTGNNQFLMLRKSLHDPIISLQIEARSVEEARATIVKPLLQIFKDEEQIVNNLDLSVLEQY